MANDRVHGWLVAHLGVAVLVPAVGAWRTGWWFATAMAVGVLFGFFLQTR